jgi:accessory gene regulator B
MFSKVISKTVNYWIKEEVITVSDRDIYEYGLELVLFSLVNIIAIILTALLFHKLTVSIALIITVIPLQCFGGGYHAATHLRCFLITYIGWWSVITLLPYIQPLSATWIVGFSLILIFKFAPVAHRNVKLSDGQRGKMRKAVRLLALGVAVVSILLCWTIDDKSIGLALAAGIGAVALSMLVARIKAFVLQV